MKIEQIEELLKLKKENPELEIKFMVHYEVVGDGWVYWMGEIEKIEKGIYVEYGEKIFIDKDELEDRLNVDFWDINKTDEENEKIFEEQLSNIKINDAILIYVGVLK